MRVLCPHCRNRVDVPVLDPDTDLTCPSCDSHIDLSGDETVTSTTLPHALIDHFELVELLGRGGYGTVFKVWDRELKREVALKIPHETSSAREAVLLMKEAQATAALDHPNIVPIYEVGKFDNRAYIVSQLIPGVSLSEYLSAKPLLPREAAGLCEKLARALHHAHERGVIHRDVKPGNILLTEELEPKLTDFGLAKRRTPNATVTADGQILGTFAYMPPEQARGDSNQVDGRADIYSLGVVLYQLLAGKKPFTGSVRMMQKQVIEDAPRPPRSFNPAVPTDLETICLKAMEKLPERRYQTAQEMADDLQRFLEGRPISARPISLWERGHRWIRRNPLLTAMGLLVVLSGGLAAALITRNTPAGTEAAEAAWTCSITSDPPGSSLVIRRLRSDWQLPDKDAEPVRITTPAQVSLVPGEYEILATRSETEFHRVWRTVPQLDQTHAHGEFPHRFFTDRDPDARTLTLPPVRLHQTEKVVHDLDMVLLPGGSFKMGALFEEHDHAVPAFYMQRHEVNCGQFRSVMREKNLYHLVRLLIPGIDNRPDDEPVSGVPWDFAVAFAEHTGSTLPDDAEYEYAATSLGTSRFPWGDDPAPDGLWDSVHPNPKDISRQGIAGLFSGVGEWTRSSAFEYSEQFPHLFRTQGAVYDAAARDAAARRRTIRGIPEEALNGWTQNGPLSNKWTPRRLRSALEVIPIPDSGPRVGFRCVRLARPVSTGE